MLAEVGAGDQHSEPVTNAEAVRGPSCVGSDTFFSETPSPVLGVPIVSSLFSLSKYFLGSLNPVLFFLSSMLPLTFLGLVDYITWTFIVTTRNDMRCNSYTFYCRAVTSYPSAFTTKHSALQLLFITTLPSLSRLTRCEDSESSTAKGLDRPYQVGLWLFPVSRVPVGSFHRVSCLKPCLCGDRARRGCRSGCVSAGFTALGRRNANTCGTAPVYPRDGTDAPYRWTIGCPLHRISRTKRNNGTHEKSLMDSMNSDGPPQQRQGPDLRGAMCDVCDVDRRDFGGDAHL